MCCSAWDSATSSIRINHRQLLAGLLDAAGVEPDLHGQALIALDKMDKIGADGVLRELQERGIADRRSARARGLCRATRRCRACASSSASGPSAQAAIAELEQIFALAAATSAGPHLRFDATLARGLSYYTGAIMEITVPDLAGQPRRRRPV